MNQKLYQLLQKLRVTSSQNMTIFDEQFPKIPTIPDLKTKSTPLLLQFTYDGKYTQGSAYATDNPFSAESYIFNALFKLKYIQFISQNPDRSGRTDSGVSAQQNAVRIEVVKPVENLILQVNSLIPQFVRVLHIAVLPSIDFSLRFSCQGRRYLYQLGFYDQKAINIMNVNAQKFIGVHDFKNLSNEQSGAVRTIFTSNVIDNNGIAEFQVYGQAFCRNQVRCMAGALIESLEREGNIEDYFNGGQKQYQMATSYRLCLIECVYGEKINWTCDKKSWQEHNLWALNNQISWWQYNNMKQGVKEDEK